MSLGSGDASGDDEGSGNWIDPALYDVYTGNRSESGYIPLDSDGNPLFGATTTCEDVDECVLGLHDCNYDLVQTCYNTAPGEVLKSASLLLLTFLIARYLCIGTLK